MALRTCTACGSDEDLHLDATLADGRQQLRCGTCGHAMGARRGGAGPSHPAEHVRQCSAHASRPVRWSRRVAGRTSRH